MCHQEGTRVERKTAMMDGMELKSDVKFRLGTGNILCFNKEVQKENVIKLNLFTTQNRENWCVTSTDNTNNGKTHCWLILKVPLISFRFWYK